MNTIEKQNSLIVIYSTKSIDVQNRILYRIYLLQRCANQEISLEEYIILSTKLFNNV